MLQCYFSATGRQRLFAAEPNYFTQHYQEVAL